MEEAFGIFGVAGVVGILWWLLFSLCIGGVASSRGRSAFDWIILSILISPLAAFALLAIMPMRYHVSRYLSNGKKTDVWWTERKIKEVQFRKELDRTEHSCKEAANEVRS